MRPAGVHASPFAAQLDRLLGGPAAAPASLPAVPAREAPCSGPGCSDGRGTLPPAPTVAPTRVAEWADLAPSPIPSTPGPSAAVADEPVGHPSRARSRLDRPPRPLRVSPAA